jgi:hypothetical protein
MADLELATKLLAQLRQAPNATPAEALEKFRRLVAAEKAKARQPSAPTL